MVECDKTIATPTAAGPPIAKSMTMGSLPVMINTRNPNRKQKMTAIMTIETCCVGASFSEVSCQIVQLLGRKMPIQLCRVVGAELPVVFFKKHFIAGGNRVAQANNTPVRHTRGNAHRI